MEVRAILEEFISLMRTEFDLDNISTEELLNLWSRVHPEPNVELLKEPEPIDLLCDTPHIEHQPTEIVPEDEQLLLKLKRPELVRLCKERNLKVSGNKKELVERLLGKTVSTPSEPKRQKTTTAAKKKRTSKKKLKTTVLDTLVANRPLFEISRNDFGNYEHRETTFVFDPSSKRVIGKQGTDGSILPLSTSDIHVCQEYKFDFVMPPNLNIA